MCHLAYSFRQPKRKICAAIREIKNHLGVQNISQNFKGFSEMTNMGQILH